MLNKVQLEMILNGCKMDEDGNIIKKKKLWNSKISNPYSNVKSRFREASDSFYSCRKSKSKSNSKALIMMEEQFEKKRLRKRRMQKHNFRRNGYSTVTKLRRERYNNEEDSSYVTSLINQCKIFNLIYS
jgi:hypothetical protein